MANGGGAWQSDVFDNGSDFQKGPAPKTTSPVPGVPAAMYNPPASLLAGAAKDGSHLPVLSIVLRAACIVFSVLGFALIASNQGSYKAQDYSSSNIYLLSWNAIRNSNLAYLLAVDVIVCVYSIVQLVLSVVSSCSGKPVLASPTRPASTITFVFDQALTYMLMAGCGAGACVSANVQKGESGSLSCGSGFQVFCDKNAAAVSMSFVAFLCLALSSGMAYYRVYKMARI